LLSVVVEMFKVLLHCVDGLVSVVVSLKMLNRTHGNGVCEVSGNSGGRMLAEKTLHELANQIPTESGHETWSVVNFNEDSLEILILAHGDTA
jgi:hypothetical protein